MKFNWGTGIVIYFLFFAVCMTTAVVATYSHPPQMVQNDYYTLDLNYQDRIEKKQNTATLAALPTLRFDVDRKVIQLQWPAGMTAQSGTVHCYRSSTMHDDITTPFANISEMDIPADGFMCGRWHVELDWIADGKAYFWETVFVR
ncbi:MAG: FixH family protein [Saprospiraceae bacterium]